MPFHAGQVVNGVVIEHRLFGTFVDLGDSRWPGLVHLLSLSDDPSSSKPSRPPVGSRLTCVLLGFSGQQPRLSLRPSHLRAAAQVGLIEALPPQDRPMFLHWAVRAPDPYIAEAAAWRVRLLPASERAGLLRAALSHPSDQVHYTALGQVADLPEVARWAFLRDVLGHEGASVARMAVFHLRKLPKSGARARFLEWASRHPAGEVALEANWQLQYGHQISA